MIDYLLIRKEFAERLHGLMIERGLNANKLSKLTGISPKTLSHWLNNQRSIQTDALWFLADFFEVSVDYLIGRENSF